MHSLLATTLIGLCVLQGSDRGAATSEPSGTDAAPRSAPQRLAPVANDDHRCVYFDEAVMRGRLLDPDLDERERAFDDLVALARSSAPIRATVQAWSRETGALELAWTARLALRELELEAHLPTPAQPRFHLHEPRPWELQYRELLEQSGRHALLDRLGLDPGRYRIRGFMQLSTEQAERMGLLVPDSGAEAQSTGTDPDRARPDHAAEVLGVVCDESLQDRVVLTRVVPGSIADAIGLEVGDRLLRVGELELEGPEDVTEAMHRWNERDPQAPDVLEVQAVDALTGGEVVKVWAPYFGR